jgi:hypothetical protein
MITRTYIHRFDAHCQHAGQQLLPLEGGALIRPSGWNIHVHRFDARCGHCGPATITSGRWKEHLCLSPSLIDLQANQDFFTKLERECFMSHVERGKEISYKRHGRKGQRGKQSICLLSIYSLNEGIRLSFEANKYKQCIQKSTRESLHTSPYRKPANNAFTCLFLVTFGRSETEHPHPA